MSTENTSRYEHVRALIIDIDNSMRQILSSMLRSLGVRSIFMGTNEQQFRDILAQEKINLVLCGWHATRLDGLALLNQIRQNEKTEQMPFMLITDVIDQELVKQAILNGVSEYIVPPFNKMMLESRLNRALKMPIRSSATNVTQRLNARRFAKRKELADISILVVDDVADNIEVIRGTLKDHYPVRATTNARNALKVCTSDSPPDLVLLDIMMPEVDGLALCKELKRNAMTQNIVVIFLTALSETGDIVRGLELGAVDYITKPVVPAVLLARVNTQARLILNQRMVQGQIDSLIESKDSKDKLDLLMQQEMSRHIAAGAPSIEELENRIKPGNVIFDYLERVKYSWSSLSLLVSNMQTLAKLEADNYAIKVTFKDVSTLVRFLFDHFQIPAKDANVTLIDDIDMNCMVKVDERLVIATLCCLTRNAIEASPRGGKVQIKATNVDGFVLVSIHNQGEIDEQIRDTFFNLYVSSKKEKGNGVGVYFAFKAVAQLKGEMYFHTSARFGTTFYIKLPRK